MKTIDVGSAIDKARWSGYQKLLIFATALTIILDGIDNQIIGPTIPALMKEWNLPRGAFQNVLAAGPFGMMFGGLFGGMLGDRVGRRNALLGSVISFAVITLGISFVHSVDALVVLRFLAGLGLGGAMPNAAVLASEYVPRAKRALAVTVTIVCVPLGGTLAAYTAGPVIDGSGWRTLFQLAGILPVIVGLSLFFVLPESPKYLAGRRERWPELRRLLGRFGHNIPEDASFVVADSAGKKKVSIGSLFQGSYLRDTVGLFGSFFFCLMANYISISWLVTFLRDEKGFAQTPAGNILTGYNLGGVAGALFAAVVIQRFGSRFSMLALCVMSAAGGILLGFMQLDPKATVFLHIPVLKLDVTALFLMVAITGGLMNAVQTTMYALAAHVYPTEIRATGVGIAVAVGRVGHVLSAYAGAWAMNGGQVRYFGSWAIGMVIVFCTLAVVGRHIERNSAVVPAGH